jgi:hypothetical protein
VVVLVVLELLALVLVVVELLRSCGVDSPASYPGRPLRGTTRKREQR